MPPILECSTRAAMGQGVEPIAIVGAEAAERRHVVRAHEDIDRVDLNDAEAVEEASQGRAIDGCAAHGTWCCEALRGEHDRAGIWGRHIRHAPIQSLLG